jgi:hypothetical protein
MPHAAKQIDSRRLDHTRPGRGGPRLTSRSAPASIHWTIFPEEGHLGSPPIRPRASHGDWELGRTGGMARRALVLHGHEGPWRNADRAPPRRPKGFERLMLDGTRLSAVASRSLNGATA